NYGVTYMFENTIWDFKFLGVKNNYDDSYGPVLMWNNTFYSDYANATHASRAFNIALTIWNYDVRNNIFYNRDWGLTYGTTNVSTTQNQFDYNLWQSPGTNIWQLNGLYQSTISGIQSSYQW